MVYEVTFVHSMCVWPLMDGAEVKVSEWLIGEALDVDPQCRMSALKSPNMQHSGHMGQKNSK